MARLPPVHHLVDDDVRERGNAAARGGRRRPSGSASPAPTRPGTARARSRRRTRRWSSPSRTTRHGQWQGPFRAGHLDAVALGYAAEVTGGVDAVALTHLDVAGRRPLRVCRAYQVNGLRLTRIVPGPERDLRWQEGLTRTLLRARPVYDDPACGDPGQDWPGIFEEMLGAPVVLRSYGPTVAGQRASLRTHAPGQGRRTRGLSGTLSPGIPRESVVEGSPALRPVSN